MIHRSENYNNNFSLQSTLDSKFGNNLYMTNNDVVTSSTILYDISTFLAAFYFDYWFIVRRTYYYSCHIFKK